MKQNTDWLDKNSYPFKPKYLNTTAGKIHYVDEGKGHSIVMVHGNPTWSYLYRHFISALSATNRCIAMDHIGFGLSEKPQKWSYLPQDHAENVEKLIRHLGLTNITLIVQDWGGPIGLQYALNNPGNIKNTIIMNTWLWSVKGDPHYERFSSFMGGGFGRFLIRRFNFFVNVVMPKAYGNKKLLTKEIHLHYKKPLGDKNSRIGCAEFPKQIISSSDWLNSLHHKISAIENIPVLLLWGLKDIAFRKKELSTWQNLLKNSTTIEYPTAGHFLQEEKPAEIIEEMKHFISHNKPQKKANDINE